MNSSIHIPLVIFYIDGDDFSLVTATCSDNHCVVFFLKFYIIIKVINKICCFASSPASEEIGAGGGVGLGLVGNEEFILEISPSSTPCHVSQINTRVPASCSKTTMIATPSSMGDRYWLRVVFASFFRNT